MEATIQIPAKRVRVGQLAKFHHVEKDLASGLDPALIRRLKKKARTRAPSETWVDAQFPEHEGIDADGNPITITTNRPENFPPGGKLTLMVPCYCTACGGKRIHPPAITTRNGLGRPLCLDDLPDKYHKAFGRSPSAMAIRRAQAMNLRIDSQFGKRKSRKEKKEIPSAKKSDLRREIKVFLKSQV